MTSPTKTAAPVSLRAAIRHEAIRYALEVNGRVSTPELTDRLGVSAVTIREDLKHLELQGVLTRTRGGALAMPGSGAEMALELTSMTNRAAKHAIGSYAASLITNGQTVIIDVGSTTTALANALSSELNGVVVITNGLNIALSLESRPGVSVIVTGGTLRPLQHSLVAPMGTLLLEKLKADVAFLGCNGVDPVRGFTNTNIAEAEIKQVMLQSADYTVFLADHDKIGNVASAFVADVESVDLLVTDSGAGREVLGRLREKGLKTETVEPFGK
ncbi:MAG: DeoR/GlpR transcriptional regulator [bacterium]|nr:DeoR/GlpR transcriptional regulator [bacterium]